MRGSARLFWIALLLFSSCSSSKVISFHNDEFDLSSIKTFAIRVTHDRERLTEAQQQVDSILLETIMRQMRSRGYEPSKAPDVFVSYEVSINSKSESRVNEPSYYSRRYYSPYDYSVTTYNYTQGMILVEVKNSEGRLIWQGSKDFKVKKNVSTQELLRQSIIEIIANYPEKS